MIDIVRFIAENVTHRVSSLFEEDVQANAVQLTQEIDGKSVCVIG